MQDIMDALKAVGDENRVRILCALDDRELCVCQIIELLGVAPSTVSRHLSILRTARLVESRKDGRWMHYRLAAKSRIPAAAKITRIIHDSLKDSWQIQQDKKQLGKILKMDTEKLCRTLMKRK
ncbi:ArsR/SmtB family transcription factor [Verrucomicrobiota bacterium]